MKHILLKIIPLFFITKLAFGDCDGLYRAEIEKLNKSLIAVGKNPVAMDIMRRRNSLKLVADTLVDISRHNWNGSATGAFYNSSGINPKTLHNILRRANKRDELCKNGALLDSMEITNLIKNGRLN